MKACYGGYTNHRQQHKIAGHLLLTAAAGSYSRCQLARRYNEYLASLAADYPGQFAPARISGTVDSSRLLHCSGFPYCSVTIAVKAQGKFDANGLAEIGFFLLSVFLIALYPFNRHYTVRPTPGQSLAFPKSVLASVQFDTVLPISATRHGLQQTGKG